MLYQDQPDFIVPRTTWQNIKLPEADADLETISGTFTSLISETMSEGHIQACFKALVATCTKRPLTCLEIDALLSIYTRDLTDIFAVPQCASRDSSGRIVFPFNNKLEYESLINGKRFIASAFSNGQHIIGYIYDIELSTLYGFDTVNADKRPELQTLAQQWRNQLKKCGVEGWIDVFHAPCTASLENWQCGYLVISMLHRCIRGLVGNNVDFLIQAELLDDKPSVYDLPWALPLRDWTDPDYHYSRHASLENVLEVVATTLMHELSVKAIPHDWYCKMDKRVSIGDVDWAKLTASDKYQKKIDYAATRTVLGGFVPISINGNWKVFDDAYRRVFPFDEGKKNTVVRMFRGLQGTAPKNVPLQFQKR